MLRLRREFSASRRRLTWRSRRARGDEAPHPASVRTNRGHCGVVQGGDAEELSTSIFNLFAQVSFPTTFP